MAQCIIKDDEPGKVAGVIRGQSPRNNEYGQ